MPGTRRPIATFSIVAHDPERQEWGVAVQSEQARYSCAVTGTLLILQATSATGQPGILD